MKTETLERPVSVGTVDGFTLGRIFRYHREPYPQACIDFDDIEPEMLKRIPSPAAGEGFWIWTQRLVAGGWIINWETP